MKNKFPYKMVKISEKDIFEMTAIKNQNLAMKQAIREWCKGWCQYYRNDIHRCERLRCPLYRLKGGK